MTRRLPDMVAVVVTDDLVMRSEPKISSDSAILEPWLQRRAQLCVLQGPDRASGYEWYEVLPLSAMYEPSGWVAAASRDGEPWIEPASTAASCPAMPSTIAHLRRLTDGVRLTCFGGVAITIRARLTSCGPENSDAFHEPDMFNGVCDPRTDLPVPVLLSNPQVDPCSGESWPQFSLHLDPAGTRPDPLPMGDVVEVTGTFDHPAARSCTWSSMIEPVTLPDPGYCRPTFVVTRVE